ncbi:MAG: hypothetical protein ACK5C6_00335, partial [Roseiflexaceae bacterium]
MIVLLGQKYASGAIDINIKWPIQLSAGSSCRTKLFDEIAGTIKFLDPISFSIGYPNIPISVEGDTDWPTRG